MYILTYIRRLCKDAGINWTYQTACKDRALQRILLTVQQKPRTPIGARGISARPVFPAFIRGSPQYFLYGGFSDVVLTDVFSLLPDRKGILFLCFCLLSVSAIYVPARISTRPVSLTLRKTLYQLPVWMLCIVVFFICIYII